MTRKLAIGVALALTLAVSAAAAVETEWAWLFPLVGLNETGDPADQTFYHVVGSDRSFAPTEMQDLTKAVDWFPAEHPPMPGIVATGHDKTNACGFCHQPDGNGRPENSALAGLPADYIKRQVHAFADGSRSAMLGSLPIRLMAATANAVTPPELDQAAAYFSALHYLSHVRVIETKAAAFRPARFVYALAPGPMQPIGDRIIEVPIDAEGFERRDPHMRYVAFVPPGSIAAGQAIVTSGGAAGQPCAACHGAGLRGGIAPPIAGRSPSMLLRQLVAFRLGTRADPEAAPMRAIAAALDDKAMIAAAVYAATLKP